jgi:hypothetical protein
LVATGAVVVEEATDVEVEGVADEGGDEGGVVVAP